MIDGFLNWVYPAVLIAAAVLALTGVVTALWIKAHAALKAVVTGMYLVTVVEVVIAALALFDSKAPVVLTIGYLLAAAALLPLLGIGRLGEPDAPGSGKTPDPERPILQADQIARVDAVAAIIVAIAAAVVAWRIAVIFEGAL